MVAMSDESEDGEELSIGDVATAFLKGDEYSESDRPRYVTYRQYRGTKLRVFREIPLFLFKWLGRVRQGC